MGNYYTRHTRFYHAVDCVVFGFDDRGLQLLLIKRDFEPHLGKWSLMGGFLEENEDTDQAAHRILVHLTGLSNVYLEQIGVFSAVHRDPGARVISTAYFALVRIESIQQDIKRDHGARWFNITRLPQLAFDHQDMVGRGLEIVRLTNRFHPTGLELLPEKFTMAEIQKLHEELYQKKYDNSNFRKKMLSLDFLIKLDEKEKESSRKGAYYYTFDKRHLAKMNKKQLLFTM